MKKDVCLLVLLLLFTGMIASCSSGGGGGYLPPVDSGVRLTGTVAAGAPIAGVVNVKGANGAAAQTTIDTDGKFSFTDKQLAALTKPYILFAQGTVNGKTAKLYSATGADGTINITPITDFILRNALAGAAETAYTNWDTASGSVTSASLDAAETKVKDQLAPIMNAIGVSSNVDLMSGQFNADHTGIDKVLDVVSIAYDNTGTAATVTNNVTGSSFTDDVTTTGDDAAAMLPAGEETATTAAISDEDAINNAFTALCTMYATAKPSGSQITAWVDANVAADFLEMGENREQMRDSWIVDNEGPGVGCTLTAALSALVTNPTPSYSRGYVVSIAYSDNEGEEDFETQMVFNGTKWLWYGDQEWLDTEIDAEAHRNIGSGGTSFFSGIGMWINDNYSYAYNRGVRSAVVSVAAGSGAVDVVLGTLYPEPWYDIVSGCQNNDYGNHCWLSDTTIGEINDYAEYTIKLCSNDAAAIAGNPAGCTVLQTYTGAIGKKPLLNTQLSNSLFPTLTTPSSLSKAGMGWDDGLVRVTWTNPSSWKVDDVQLHWWDSNSDYWRSEEEVMGTKTSVNLDTLGTTTAPLSAMIWMDSWQDNEISFSASWDFYQP